MRVDIKILDGPQKGKLLSFLEYQKLSMGRSAEVHLSFPEDQKLSRYHLVIEISPQGCFLRDCGSSNGTFFGRPRSGESKVNFDKIDETELQHGDCIRAGRTLLQILMPDPPNKHSAPKKTDHLSGQSIGHLEILHVLGSGSMGTVYLSRHIKLDQLFALKIAHPAMVPDQKQIQRFLREAECASQLRHNNIVRYYKASYLSDGSFFIPMEYVQGVDLLRYMEQSNKALSLNQCQNWLFQLLDALEYLHENKFIHRDIKPANVLLQERNGELFPKLTDFGLAKNFEQAGLNGITLSQQGMGTLDYVSPEQLINARNVDPRADIYSVCATFYHVLSNRTLFQAKHPTEMFYRIMNEHPLPLHEIAPVPLSFSQILMQCLLKYPEERIQTIAELKKHLQSSLK